MRHAWPRMAQRTCFCEFSTATPSIASTAFGLRRDVIAEYADFTSQARAEERSSDLALGCSSMLKTEATLLGKDFDSNEKVMHS